MYDSYIRILGISLHLQDASCCCHNINTAKAAVLPFGAFFFVEVSNQNDSAVVTSSPHSKAAHEFPRSACDLQIGIAAKISLNRIDHDQSRPKFNDCLTDALIIQCKIAYVRKLYFSWKTNQLLPFKIESVAGSPRRKNQL